PFLLHPPLSLSLSLSFYLSGSLVSQPFPPPSLSLSLFHAADIYCRHSLTGQRDSLFFPLTPSHTHTHTHTHTHIHTHTQATRHSIFRPFSHPEWSLRIPTVAPVQKEPTPLT